MDSSDDGELDAAFLALADPVRRRIIARLSRGPATVNELAEPFAITKQAVSKHIQVLEQAQLVTRTRDAQRRPVHLNPARLEALTAWIDQYRLVREGQFRSLDAVLEIRAAQAAHRQRMHHEQRTEIDRPRGTALHRFRAGVRFSRAEVFRAHKEPELVAQWLGPRRLTMAIDHYDFRTGGSYRYTHTAPDGSAYGFNGVFHTVRENDFAIQTFEFDGYPDVVSIEFLTFEDLGGGRSRLSGPRGLPQHGGPRRHGAVRNGGRHVRSLRTARGSPHRGQGLGPQGTQSSKVRRRQATFAGKVACRRRT